MRPDISIVGAGIIFPILSYWESKLTKFQVNLICQETNFKISVMARNNRILDIYEHNCNWFEINCFLFNLKSCLHKNEENDNVSSSALTIIMKVKNKINTSLLHLPQQSSVWSLIVGQGT